MKTYVKLFLILVFPVILYGCGQDPQPIEYGVDNCSHCMMQITDNKYAVELITKKGKCFKFDAVECLVQHLLENDTQENKEAALWINDFTGPSQFINAKDAFYLQNEKFHSPMGFNVLACGDYSKLKKIRDEHGGVEYDWNSLVELVKKMQ